MGRVRVRVEEVLAEASEQQRLAEHSLAAFVKRSDIELEAAIEEEKHSQSRLLSMSKKLGKSVDELDDFIAYGIVGPMLATMTEKARGVRPREEKEVSAYRWPNEIAALKATPFERHATGNTGRVIEHRRIGASIQKTMVLHIPLADEDPYLVARNKVFATMEPSDMQLLVWMFVELYPPSNKLNAEEEPIGVIDTGSAQRFAAALREQTADLMTGSLLERSTVTAAHLVAERAGEIVEGGDHDGVAKMTAKKISRARKELRTRLAAVDLGAVQTRWLVPK